MAMHCSWKLNWQLIFYSHLLLKYYLFLSCFSISLYSTQFSSDQTLNFLSTLTSAKIHHPLTTASPPPKLNYHPFFLLSSSTPHRPTPLPHAANLSCLCHRPSVGCGVVGLVARCLAWLVFFFLFVCCGLLLLLLWWWWWWLWVWWRWLWLMVEVVVVGYWSLWWMFLLLF